MGIDRKSNGDWLYLADVLRELNVPNTKGTWLREKHLGDDEWEKVDGRIFVSPAAAKKLAVAVEEPKLAPRYVLVICTRLFENPRWIQVLEVDAPKGTKPGKCLIHRREHRWARRGWKFRAEKISDNGGTTYRHFRIAELARKAAEVGG